MDKYEYNLKLDQMKSLCAEEHYAAAAEIADTINWNKVKNVNALVKAGEVYEKLERYAESRDILLMAYDRSPIGRTIIFRLAEVAIKMKDFDSATEYYTEFVEIAPHDNLRYVLQYDMKKAQGADYSELISILEELKEVEYTEEWAYELAYLYHKAGKADKCVDACDELILWFGDGPYVERALELKMIYQPLTKAQEEKYRRFRLEKQGITPISAEEMERAGEYIHDAVEIPEIDVNTKFNTVNLQKEIAKGMQQIINATEKTTVSDTIDNIKKIVEEIPYLQIQSESDALKEEETHIETDEEIDGSLKINFKEMLGEDADGQISLVTKEKAMLERQITGQMTIQDVLREWEKTKVAAEKALEKAEQQKLESAKARALQEAGDIMDRLNDVIPKLDAGISPKEILKEKYMEGAVDRQAVEPAIRIEAVRDQEELVSDGNLEEEDSYSMETASIPEIEPVMIGALSGEPELPETEVSGIEVSGGQEIAQAMMESGQIIDNMNQLLGREIDRLSSENQFIDEQITRAAAELPSESNMTEPHEETPTEVPISEQQEEKTPFADSISERQEKETPFADSISEQQEKEIPTEDPVAEPDKIFSTKKAPDKPGIGRTVTRIAFGPAAAKARMQETEMEAVQSGIGAIGHAAEAVLENVIDHASKGKPSESTAESPAIEDTDSTKASDGEEEILDIKTEIKTMFGPGVQTPAVETGAEAVPDLSEGLAAPDAEKQKELNKAVEEVIAQEAAKPKKEPGIVRRQKTKPMPSIKSLKKAGSKFNINPLTESTVPKEMLEYYDDSNKEELKHLTEEQKAVFSYFVPVSGMEHQLSQTLEAIAAHLRRNEPAYTGNLIIQGGQGCGKTVLATSMIRALQKETNKPNNKIGKIDAATLNKKDIQMLLRKVEGGCLIIEKAGGLSKQAAVTLSLLLEQERSGLLVILEDTSKGIKRALAQDDGFAKKFTEKISVPIFTNDDLVAFAKAYSTELGYMIDDLAILALYNRISNIQRLDQATTLTEVKDIVDEAIDREARGGLHKFFSILTAKRYSEDDRIILQEKDFE